MYSLNDKSIKQRIDFWKDCIKIAKDHPIIGQGGNTWKKLSYTVQEYFYIIKETHSYLFELLISYGIIGVTLYLLLIISFNIKLLKECIKNKEQCQYKLSILFGLDILICHSLFFDFNMSFLVILLVFYVYMATLMYNQRDEIQKFKTFDYIVLILLTCILGILILSNVAKYLIKDKELRKNIGFYDASYQYQYINYRIENSDDFRLTLDEIKKMMKKEPYFNQSELYEKYWNILLNNLENLNNDEVVNYLKFINNQYCTIKFYCPMCIDEILPRVRTMQKAYLILEGKKYDMQELIEQIAELKQIIENEYEVNIVNIKDEERNGLTQEKIKNIIKEYTEILEEIKI